MAMQQLLFTEETELACSLEQRIYLAALKAGVSDEELTEALTLRHGTPHVPELSVSSKQKLLTFLESTDARARLLAFIESGRPKSEEQKLAMSLGVDERTFTHFLTLRFKAPSLSVLTDEQRKYLLRQLRKPSARAWFDAYMLHAGGGVMAGR